ncbi:MAG: serine protease [Acidimicrobiales bacterium]
MSPPREHPGSDTSFADRNRLAELRAHRNPAGKPGDLSVEDLFPGGRRTGGPGAPTEEISADELLRWFEGSPTTPAAAPSPPIAPTPPAIGTSPSSSPGSSSSPSTSTNGDAGPRGIGGGAEGPLAGTALARYRPGGERLPEVAPPPVRLEDLGAPATLRPSGLRSRLYRRRYGVAPFVRPSARRGRRKRRRDYRQLGFVELTPEKLRLRHKILPRTVLGASMLLMAMGVGAAFSGASFYAYYDWRTTKNEAELSTFAEGFQQTFTGAQEQLEMTRNQAITEVNNSLEPLRVWAGDANAVAELPAKIGGGVFFVRTLDTAGKPSAGSAFVVSSGPSESLLLTSYQVVAAAAARPGPGLTLEKGGESFPAELWAWDADRDLALLKTAKGNLPALLWAGEAQRSRIPGTRVYAVSGSGGQGATASPGLAVDASTAGIRHDVPVSPEFRGAPLTNGLGQVLGVVSTNYTPTGIETGELPFSPFITAACERVLRCPDSVTASTAPAAPGAGPTAGARTG